VDDPTTDVRPENPTVNDQYCSVCKKVERIVLMTMKRHELLPFFRRMQRVSAIFSDMRQDARGLSLERLPHSSVEALLSRVAAERLIPDLKGVRVSVLGANTARQKPLYWQDVRDFWSEFFDKAGGVFVNEEIWRLHSNTLGRGQ
jgi:hypothetical protein